MPDQSVFKQAFLDLLEGRDAEPIPDHYITGEELGLYLKTKVPRYNPSQHPQYGKIKDPRLDKGDFVFALKRPEPVRPPQPQPSELEAEKKRLAAETAQIERERQELAQLKLELEKQKLETERRRLEMEKKREEEQKLAAISKEAIDDAEKQPASEPPHSVAIFPWLLKNDADYYFDYTLSRVIKKIDQSHYLNLSKSYYKTAGISYWRKIKPDIIDSNSIDKLWQKKSFFQSKKPNVKLVQQLGEKLEVDAVLMLDFNVEEVAMESIVRKIVIFLIDVKTGELFSVENMQPISLYMGYFMDELDSYLTEVINDYVDYKY